MPESENINYICAPNRAQADKFLDNFFNLFVEDPEDCQVILCGVNLRKISGERFTSGNLNMGGTGGYTHVPVVTPDGAFKGFLPDIKIQIFVRGPKE